MCLIGCHLTSVFGVSGKRTSQSFSQQSKQLSHVSEILGRVLDGCLGRLTLGLSSLQLDEALICPLATSISQSPALTKSLGKIDISVIGRRLIERHYRMRQKKRYASKNYQA